MGEFVAEKLDGYDLQAFGEDEGDGNGFSTIRLTKDGKTLTLTYNEKNEISLSIKTTDGGENSFTFSDVNVLHKVPDLFIGIFIDAMTIAHNSNKRN